MGSGKPMAAGGFGFGSFPPRRGFEFNLKKVPAKTFEFNLSEVPAKTRVRIQFERAKKSSLLSFCSSLFSGFNVIL